MGYACPVCETPQADATHLANHLAFTAMLHDDEHAAWLDAHCPDWADAGEAALADCVVDHAATTAFPTAPDDDRATSPAPGATESGEQTHDHDAGAHGRDRPSSGRAPFADPADDETVEAVLEEARELTRQRRANRRSQASDDDADTDTDTDADTDADATE